MNKDLVNTAILAMAFLCLFGIAELLYYRFDVRAELTRKLVHIGTGLLTLLFPVMLHDQWLVLFLCTTFAIIILASLQFDFLRSINGIDRKSYGSIAYPISVYGCYLVYNHYMHTHSAFHPYIYFYLPILTLAICDPVAALVGKSLPYGKFFIGRDTKTIVGSLAFFVSSVILTIAVSVSLAQGLFSITGILPFAVSAAAAAAFAEAVSGRGIDNITIPFTMVLSLILFT